jgi:hypothetical protein
MAVEKALRLESTKRFPLFHRHDGCVEERTTKGLLRREGDEEQSNGVSENLVAKMRPS